MTKYIGKRVFYFCKQCNKTFTLNKDSVEDYHNVFCSMKCYREFCNAELKEEPTLPNEGREIEEEIEKILTFLDDLEMKQPSEYDVWRTYKNVRNSLRDWLPSFLTALCTKYGKEREEKLAKDFIKEFCNDHGGEIRWLRSVALDTDDLLEQILQFFATAQAEREGE
jgi:hypothetical protein